MALAAAGTDVVVVVLVTAGCVCPKELTKVAVLGELSEEAQGLILSACGNNLRRIGKLNLQIGIRNLTNIFYLFSDLYCKV